MLCWSGTDDGAHEPVPARLAIGPWRQDACGLFQPLRGRVQRVVDRRFNRARADADRTVGAFAGRLRDEVDLAQLGAEITSTVAGAVQPVSVGLWLRG